MRRQITDWEEISPKDTTDKEQLSKINKDSQTSADALFQLEKYILS